jgi:methyl coenzyme M reductase gamma subunit
MAKKLWADMNNDQKLEELHSLVEDALTAIDGLAHTIQLPANHPSLRAMGEAIDGLKDDVSDLQRQRGG